MSQKIMVGHGPALGNRELHELLPPATLQEAVALEAQVDGFRMETYDCPPGTFPPVQFRSHMIGVGMTEQTRCSVFWREHGVTKSRKVFPASIFTASAGPLDHIHWDGRLQVLALSIEPVSMETVLPEPFSRRPVELLVVHAGARDSVLSHLLECIKAEEEGGFLGGRLFIESLCQAAALYIALRYGAVRPKLPSYKAGLSRERLSRVLEYIDAYLASDLSINTLAGVACLSPYHFGKMFRRSTGVTVHAYVTQRRVVRAQRLLRGSGLSLSEVASAAGFYDQSRMTAVFKHYAHMTPRVYRMLVE